MGHYFGYSIITGRMNKTKKPYKPWVFEDLPRWVKGMTAEWLHENGYDEYITEKEYIPKDEEPSTEEPTA